MRPGEQVYISEEGDDGGRSRRHPLLAYLLGDLVRGLYVVGCMALDILAPVQVRDLLPGWDPVTVPVLVVGFAGLALLQLRLYRRLWPPQRQRRLPANLGGRGP